MNSILSPGHVVGEAIRNYAVIRKYLCLEYLKQFPVGGLLIQDGLFVYTSNSLEVCHLSLSLSVP